MDGKHSTRERGAGLRVDLALTAEATVDYAEETAEFELPTHLERQRDPSVVGGDARHERN